MKICRDCKYHDSVEYQGEICYHPTVQKEPERICPVTGNLVYRGHKEPYCNEINTDGNCELFESHNRRDPLIGFFIFLTIFAFGLYLILSSYKS